ncbi:hypothetical protein [Pilimelia terevasa]|nr:hypothetical protein [Pilimelia terevasa]
MVPYRTDIAADRLAGTPATSADGRPAGRTAARPEPSDVTVATPAATDP